MQITELRQNMLLQYGRLLIKVSTVYKQEHRFTATVCLENGKPPGRTTVRNFAASDLAVFYEPTSRMIAKYDAAYGPPAVTAAILEGEAELADESVPMTTLDALEG